MFHHLITSHKVGDDIVFDIWRDGAKQQLKVQAKNFDVGEMLVPYYEYGQQPEYVVTGGFVFQKLTRPYLTNWGKDWDGKVTPHLLHYLRDMAFKPTVQRREIVILSYVLPAQINLGYTDLAAACCQQVQRYADKPNKRYCKGPEAESRFANMTWWNSSWIIRRWLSRASSCRRRTRLLRQTTGFANS